MRQFVINLKIIIHLFKRTVFVRLVPFDKKTKIKYYRKKIDKKPHTHAQLMHTCGSKNCEGKRFLVVAFNGKEHSLITI